MPRNSLHSKLTHNKIWKEKLLDRSVCKHSSAQSKTNRGENILMNKQKRLTGDDAAALGSQLIGDIFNREFGLEQKLYKAINGNTYYVHFKNGKATGWSHDIDGKRFDFDRISFEDMVANGLIIENKKVTKKSQRALNDKWEQQFKARFRV